MITVKQYIIDEIKAHGKMEAPIEACGYITGKAGTALGIIKMKNVDESAEHFSFDSREQFKALRQARSMDQKLIAVYHTHPVTPARMSEEDIRLAHDPDMIFIIYSVIENTIKAFTVHENKTVTEIKLEVIV